MALPNQNDILRKVVFVPCDTKEDLRTWIKVFLDLDMPDGRVDPSSNSSPMDLIWEVYDDMRHNRRKYTQILGYASRDSFKTLGASVLEVLAMCHLRRSVAHMAAIESQASKAQEYLKKFFSRPILRDYLSSKNERTVAITAYYNPLTGDYLTPKQVEALNDAERDQYEVMSHYCRIIVCTLAGANSEHVPFMVVDELDTVPGGNIGAYYEAKHIPSPYAGNAPVTLLTSTRKFSFGLVQKEIDNSERFKDTDKRKLQIRHWNVLDVTKRCEPERHRPDLGRMTLYRSDDTLSSLTEPEYLSLDTESRKSYVKDEGYVGCGVCPLFAACQGRLVDQTSDSTFLKDIDGVIAKFSEVPADNAKAQLLCWKPSTEGLIYGHLDGNKHKIAAAQIAEKITGQPYPENFSKLELIELCRLREMQFFTGMDWGFSHNFAVVTGVRDGNRLFIIDSFEIPGLDPSQKIEVCNERIKEWTPTVFPDPESPADIKLFRRHGFKMREWKKGKGSVKEGIDVVRVKVLPVLSKTPELYFLRNDPGVEQLFKRLKEYHWLTDAGGNLIVPPVPDPENDDGCDALRYLVMNIFGKAGRLKMDTSSMVPETGDPKLKEYTLRGWMNQVISENVVGDGRTFDPYTGQPIAGSRGKRGKLSFDIS